MNATRFDRNGWWHDANIAKGRSSEDIIHPSDLLSFVSLETCALMCGSRTKREWCITFFRLSKDTTRVQQVKESTQVASITNISHAASEFCTVQEATA